MLVFLFSFIFAIIFQITSAQSLENFLFIKEINRLNNIKSYVCLISHKDKQFVLKQAKGSVDRTIVKCVLEAIGTRIAQAIDIPCNSTQIIKPSNPHHKLYKDRPATLHSFAMGSPIARCKKFKNITIKQQCCHSQQNKGLTINIIKCMQVHPLFSRLCAVDTFIGNTDRHRGNLFYEEKTQTFTAIDFNNAGKINLALIAQKNLEILASKKIVLEASVINGLKLYQDSLKKLVKLYPPQILIKNLEQYLIEATPKKINKKISNKLDSFYKSYKKFAFETYNSSQKLITTIEKLIQNQQKT